MIVIADVAKQVEHLGAFPLPVEVVPFGWQTTKALVEETLIEPLDVLGRDDLAADERRARPTSRTRATTSSTCT